MTADVNTSTNASMMVTAGSQFAQVLQLLKANAHSLVTAADHFRQGGDNSCTELRTKAVHMLGKTDAWRLVTDKDQLTKAGNCWRPMYKGQ